MANKLRALIKRGVTGLSRGLNVSSSVATGILALGSVFGLGTVGTLGYTLFGTSEEVYQTQFWVDDDECVDYIQQANDMNGTGDNEIPPPNGTMFSVTVVDIQGGVPVICWSGQRNNTSAWADPCKPVFEKWRDTGQKDDQGICVINGYYLIACTTTYGNVGDQIDFFLDDGTKLPCIMADTKNPNDEGCNKWGHENGACVLEFELTVDAWEKGNTTPGSTSHTEWGGRRVSSWTNNGAVISGAGGVVDGAMSSANSVKQASSGKAMDECKAKSKYDNSTIAAAAASYSYSQRKEFGEGFPGTLLYDEVWKATVNDAYYRSCDRGVGAAVKWSGADDDFDYGGCENEYIHMAQSDLWEYVSESNANATTKSSGSAAKYSFGGSGSDSKAWAEDHLLPGDVLCTVGNEHTFMYIGSDIATEVYQKVIQGSSAPNGGDCGSPEETAVFVSASIGENQSESTRTSGPSSGRAPCIQSVGGDGREYYAFRYVGDYPYKDKYADVGDIADVAGAKTGGTSCDCAVEEECDCNDKADELEYLQEDGGGNGGTPDAAGAADVFGGQIDCTFCAAVASANVASCNYSFTPVSVAQGLQAQYGEDFVYGTPPGTPGGVEARYDVDKFYNYLADNYNVTYESGGDRLKTADGYASVLRAGDAIVTGQSASEEPLFVKEDGHSRAHLHGHSIMFYKYDGTYWWSKDSATYDGSGQIKWTRTQLEAFINADSYCGGTIFHSDSGKKCKSAEDGMLDDGPISDLQQKVIDSAKSTPTTGPGYCASWVTLVFSNAGIGTFGGHAFQMYENWCTSSDKGDLKPGMIIAVSKHSMSDLGPTYGHVGIYIGGGLVMHNVGDIETWTLDHWIDYYSTDVPAKWGWIGGKNLAAS